ncbi:hypothetical protein [Helicobacter brantae]|uniref:Uncharacterized protein n=1 Tax=Helicobacter brantae TaxID=375927 RepID=A0A3D8J2B6_9HELI|nr:hypothetical protein [Helicobacter brantae]RDU70901.1 hypothetical protein CQA58_03750 [Helicobacter brantae]
MIKNKELIHTCLHHLQTLSLGERITFKTAKKDREISVGRSEGGGYVVLENGFEHRSFEVRSEAELKKILKTLQKIEFPRSNQIWVKIERG